MLIHSARKLDADGLVDDFWLTVDGGTISAVGSGAGWREHAAGHEVTDAEGHCLTPGFIGLHAHGAGGHSYDDGRQEILAAVATHRAHGSTRSLISLVANPVEQLRESLGIVADLTAETPCILGSHMEGPFLSVGKRGAHHPAFLCEPQPDLVNELIGAARGTLRQITVAPELPNALEAIQILVEAGVTVAVGHTEASFEQTRAAFDAGARMLTHAFNAMHGIHHRAPGPVIAAFEDERVTIELILDGLHVHPGIARMAFASAPGRIALVTDAMAAAGAADGNYRLGSLNVTVTHGIALLSGTSTIAGSTLTQDLSLRCAISQAHIEPQAAVTALTATPARALGMEHTLGRLRPGFVADAVLLDHDWRLLSVWADGRPVPPAEEERDVSGLLPSPVSR
ncbi:MAG: N-acetylglucosamine-6-phosphate deacetylase [Microbacteriaceae bacterium]